MPSPLGQVNCTAEEQADNTRQFETTPPKESRGVGVCCVCARPTNTERAPVQSATKSGGFALDDADKATKGRRGSNNTHCIEASPTKGH